MEDPAKLGINVSILVAQLINVVMPVRFVDFKACGLTGAYCVKEPTSSSLNRCRKKAQGLKTASGGSVGA